MVRDVIKSDDMRILLLDLAGVIASLAVGAALVTLSGQFALQNFLLLLAFLLIGVAVTKYRHEEKREKGVYEHERSWQNVISNGIIPVLCCVGFFFSGSPQWIIAYICAVAGASADKFGSELGVLSDKPMSLRTFKPVRQGTSGAISALGTFLSFIGALSIGMLAYFLYKPDPFSIFQIAIIGFAGSLVDSVAGIFEEMGLGTKGTSNLLCTLASALIGYVALSF